MLSQADCTSFGQLSEASQHRLEGTQPSIEAHALNLVGTPVGCVSQSGKLLIPTPSIPTPAVSLGHH